MIKLIIDITNENLIILKRKKYENRKTIAGIIISEMTLKSLLFILFKSFKLIFIFSGKRGFTSHQFQLY